MQGEETKHSFAPVITANPTVLILGSIPGDKSIAENEYYAHPQNRFWKLLARLTGMEPAKSYPDKLKILDAGGIALWDVAEKAVRKGSMDSAIREYSVNDINGLLAENPTIKAVIFNGKTAEKFYNRNFEKKHGITYLSMPSTSPANAAYNTGRLFEEWSKAIKYMRTNKTEKR